MSTNVKVLRHNDYDSETIVAFYDVECDFGDGMRVRFSGLKLIRSKKDHSLFLGLPQREGANGKWYDYFTPSEALRTQLSDTLITHYEAAHKE